MARTFVAASSQTLTNASAVLTAAPLSMACWFNAAGVGANRALVYLGNGSAPTQDVFGLRVTSGNVVAATTTAAGSAASATTSTTFGASAWCHGCGVWASATDRRAFLNGGGKGTNATSRTPSGINATAIGRVVTSSPSQYWDGLIAEAGIWNVALTDDDVAALATGVSPALVRPESLVAYWPLVGRDSPETDRRGGFDLTVTGATVGDHPRAVWPRKRVGVFVPAAGGGSNADGAGSAAGVGAASGVGDELADAAGASAGVGAAAGTGDSLADAAGASDGSATASGIGDALADAAGASAGQGSGSAVGDSLADAAGNSDGTAVATGNGESLADGIGAADGAGSATGDPSFLADAAGAAAGVGSADGTGETLADGVASADGVAVATGAASSLADGIGAAAGVATAAATGSTGDVAVSRVYLVGVNSRRADLTGIDSRRADLVGVNSRQTELTGVAA